MELSLKFYFASLKFVCIRSKIKKTEFVYNFVFKVVILEHIRMSLFADILLYFATLSK